MSSYQDTRPLPATLDELFDQLNGELFGGRLPRPVNGCRYANFNTHGLVQYKGFKSGRWGTRKWENLTFISISIKPGMTVRKTRKVMVHEMCHVAELVESGRGGHDAIFWRHMAACGYPKDHVFEGQLPDEGDYYTGKHQLKQQKAEKASLWKGITPVPGDRVVTPFGQATITAVEPGAGRRKARLIVNQDGRTLLRGRFYQLGIEWKIDVCTPG